MKGTENDKPGAHREGAQKDPMEELFRHATARRRPPASDEQAIRAALHSQWQEMTGRRRRRKLLYAFAAVASLVLTVLVGAQLMKNAEPPVEAIRLASIEKVQGSVFVHSDGDGPVGRAEKAGLLWSGQQIVTGLESRLALRWRDGAGVRLDQNSEIRLGPAGEIRLVSGQVYVDSNSAPQSVSSLVILTPAGPVRHLGTQYLAQVDTAKTSLSVREGQVALEVEGVDIVMAPGEQLVVDRSGSRSRQVISTHGDLWEWAQELAPPFELDGRSLADFLDFVGRETGRTITYASVQAEQTAMKTRLRGSVEIAPGRALDAVLQTTDLVSELTGDMILVAQRK
jgi:ferric-dicitrate binding protein FerR (iron transport regulator)